jgi:hypothetical protein
MKIYLEKERQMEHNDSNACNSDKPRYDSRGHLDKLLYLRVYEPHFSLTRFTLYFFRKTRSSGKKKLLSYR